MSQTSTQRLASKPLPPLQHNYELKTLLREIDARGTLEDKDLERILTTARNVAGDEDRAIRMIVGANDIENRTSPEQFRAFLNTLSLEASCRRQSMIGQWRNAVFRMLSGGATGLGAGIAAAPALNLESTATTCVVTTIIGAYTGFRSGMVSNYGQHD